MITKIHKNYHCIGSYAITSSNQRQKHHVEHVCVNKCKISDVV